MRSYWPAHAGHIEFIRRDAYIEAFLSFLVAGFEFEPDAERPSQKGLALLAPD